MAVVNDFCGKDGLAVLVNNAGIARPIGISQFTKEPNRDLARKLDDVLAVNLRSAYLVTSAAVPLLKKAAKRAQEEGSSVVNMSSVVARTPIPGDSVYAGTKAALENFTLSASRELAGDGIRINSVHPGFIYTDLTVDPLVFALLGEVEKLTKDSYGLITPGQLVHHWMEKRGIPNPKADELKQATLTMEIPGFVLKSTLGELAEEIIGGKIPLGRLGRPEDVAEVTFAAATLPYVTGSQFFVTGGLGVGLNI